MAGDLFQDQPISFGPFRLFPKARSLEKDGVALHIGSRSLDILAFLARRPGEVVDKRELMKQVWANVNVDEGSLRFHVTGLRKALGGPAGAQYIRNVPGRGYCFVAVPPVPETSDAPAPRAHANRAHPLPPLISRLIGRDELVEKISADILLHGVVTIVGPGGIGKTSVALAVAHRNVAVFGRQTFFVDFSGLTDVSLVPSTVASALGLTVSSRDPTSDALAFLRERHSLLILDSSEHVLDVLAPLVERIAREAPETHLLVTSREALRIESERVFRIAPLNCPPSHEPLKIADISSFPAAQLFIERVTANMGELELDEEDAATVAEICRHLDGIPLAIELAAGRVDAYGIAGTAALLDSHLSLLWHGRRTAIPRHQTLNAALSWSYDLLQPIESATLRRLSVFAGTFTLDAAIAVASHHGVSKSDAAEALESLISKSLIAATSERPLRYRLLETTRTFARERLTRSGAADEVACAHAEYFRDLLEEIGVTPRGSETDLLSEPDQVPNVRAALEWSFSDRGNLTIGLDLAVSAAPLFLELGLLTECFQWTQQALASLGAASIGSVQEMELQAALAVSAMFAQGNTEAVRAAFQRCLEIAEHLNEGHWQIWLLQALHVYHTRIGDFQGALNICQRAAPVAKALNDSASTLTVEWMLGGANHMIGNQRRAVELCQSAMVRNPGSLRPDLLHLGFDDRILALVAYARGLWLIGRPDRAADAAIYTIGEGKRLKQPLNLSLALVFTIPVFLWTGDWPNAETMIDSFIDHTTKHSLGPHHAVAIGLKGELLTRRGEIADGIDHIRRGQAMLQATRYRMMSTVLATALAEALTQLNEVNGALRLIEESIAQVGNGGASFDMPEMLRVKGHILQRSGRIAEAEVCLRRSLDLSREQGALGWELRAAITLGRLLQRTGRATDAHALVEPVYRRYDEGHASMDLVAARSFLEASAAQSENVSPRSN